jgi:hypothetical protein
MMARAAILALAIPIVWVLSGCSGTYRALAQQIMSSEEIDFESQELTAYKRRDYLRIDVLIEHDAADYEPGFEREFRHAAGICAAVANSDLAFDIEWRGLSIQQFIRYGGESRWRPPAYYSHIMAFIDRDTLLGLRDRVSLADECPYLWELDVAAKSGPCNKRGYCTFGSPWPDQMPAEQDR